MGMRIGVFASLFTTGNALSSKLARRKVHTTLAEQDYKKQKMWRGPTGYVSQGSIGQSLTHLYVPCTNQAWTVV
eukprot:6198758-Pleurochrysis_carterae.AAC.1